MQRVTKQILTTYHEQAPKLSSQYQSVNTEDVLPGLKSRLPRLRGLDIACGNGRDTRWAAQQGFIMDGVDGAPGMIRQAMATNAHENVTFGVDLMPNLPGIRQKVKDTGEKYDLILMSAAWMHNDAAARLKMFRTLNDLANPGAVIFLTLRHGPAPADRPMFAVSAEELKDMADDYLIHFEHIVDGKADQLGRGDVWWDSVCLRTPKRHVDMLPVYRDSIIHAPKNSSYKLAFTHCFIDLVRNHPDLVRESSDTHYAVPLGPMLPRWIRLYDGFASEGLVQIRPQSRMADPLNVTRRFALANSGISGEDFTAGRVFDGGQAQAALRMMNAVKNVIVKDGPVRFTTRPGGQFPVFHYRPGQTADSERTVILDNDALATRFGDILVAKDIVHTGQYHGSLIDAGVMREWARFTCRLTSGADPEQAMPRIRSRIEKVLSAA